MFANRKMILFLAGFLLALAPVNLMAQGEESKSTDSLAKINGEGLVKAYPDVALLNFTILTEAPKAQWPRLKTPEKPTLFSPQ